MHEFFDLTRGICAKHVLIMFETGPSGQFREQYWILWECPECESRFSTTEEEPAEEKLSETPACPDCGDEEVSVVDAAMIG